MLKDCDCGALRAYDIGRTVRLAGWVHRRRDHGGLVFLDLRDRSGIVQVVFNPEVAPAAHEIAGELRTEFVVGVEGEVMRRPPGTDNPRLATGEVEIMVRTAVLMNPSRTPPFYINEDVEVDEALRLRYRYLDLRRPRLRDNILLRHRVVKFIRDFLDSRDFIEIETPILIKSTPEGARDYLVPSRLHPGSFYALPQSPQQLKQLLMVAGFERYYQIARCFRDEDQRADRQPEFTQLDLEMSFVDVEDILSLVEELFTNLVRTVTPKFRVIAPFPRLSYDEALARFGTDKPDLRYGLELFDTSDIVAAASFEVFRRTLAAGGRVKGLVVPGWAGVSRRQIDELTAFVGSVGGKGLVSVALLEGATTEAATLDTVRSPVARFLGEDVVRGIIGRCGAKPGDLVLMVADTAAAVNQVLAALRAELARRLELADQKLLAFAFVFDFPLLQWDAVGNRWEPMHHPFTAPVDEDIPLLDTDPSLVHAKHYDIVCNGYELSSGSIRIHRADLQEKIFRLLNYSDDEIAARFGHLLDAFAYGAPPHGGIAPGIDRLVMLLAGETTIREVIAFPKNQSAQDMLMGAPSPVAPEQLAELHLQLSETANARPDEG